MLSLTHTLISLPLAYYLDNPLLIFIAAIAGHFLCDTLLHWNLFPDQIPKKFFFPLVAADVGGGLLVAYFLTGNDFFTLPVLLAILGGNLPDIIHQLYELLPAAVKHRWLHWAAPAFVWHDRLQLETHNIGQGLITQATLVFLAIVLLLA